MIVDGINRLKMLTMDVQDKGDLTMKNTIKLLSLFLVLLPLSSCGESVQEVKKEFQITILKY